MGRCHAGRALSGWEAVPFMRSTRASRENRQPRFEHVANASRALSLPPGLLGTPLRSGTRMTGWSSNPGLLIDLPAPRRGCRRNPGAEQDHNPRNIGHGGERHQQQPGRFALAIWRFGDHAISGRGGEDVARLRVQLAVGERKIVQSGNRSSGMSAASTELAR